MMGNYDLTAAGAQPKRSLGCLWVVLGVIGAVAALWVVSVLAFTFATEPTNALSEENAAAVATARAMPSHREACAMSQEFVRRNLQAPTTAQFPDAGDGVACSADYNWNNWTVQSYVDAQNGFGAMLRAGYTVKMTYDAGTGLWTLTHIDLDE